MAAKAKSWDDLVNWLVMSPEFLATWRAVGEAGCGSVEAVDLVGKLLRESSYHRRCLGSTAEDLMARGAQWADEPMDEEHFKTFAHDVGSLVMTTAAIYLVIGAMVGVGSVNGIGDSKADANA